MEEVGQQPKTQITPEMAEIINRPGDDGGDNQTSKEPQVILEKVVIPRPDKQRHFIAVFMFSFYFGWLGIDRFYLGKYFTGFLKMITIGGFGLWVLIDTSYILSGACKDRWGNPLIDYEKYKKFARKTILLTYLIGLIFVLIVGLSIFLAIPQLQSVFQQYTDLLNEFNAAGGSGGGGLYNFPL